MSYVSYFVLYIGSGALYFMKDVLVAKSIYVFVLYLTEVTDICCKTDIVNWIKTSNILRVANLSLINVSLIYIAGIITVFTIISSDNNICMSKVVNYINQLFSY